MTRHTTAGRGGKTAAQTARDDRLVAAVRDHWHQPPVLDPQQHPRTGRK